MPDSPVYSDQTQTVVVSVRRSAENIFINASIRRLRSVVHLHPQFGLLLLTSATAAVLRYTVFWLKRFMNDRTPQRKIVGNTTFFSPEDSRCVPVNRPWDLSSGSNNNLSSIFFFRFLGKS